MKKPRKRYRYILSGGVLPSDEISDFRLCANLRYAQFSYIRICVDTVNLIKYGCDNYSTTDDSRTLDELGYDLFVIINGKSILRNDLKPTNIDMQIDTTTALYNEGYIIGGRGWTDKETYAKQFK